MTDILTTREAAAYLRLGKPTLERFRCTGQGPAFVKISNRAVRYRRADLEAWLTANTINSSSERSPSQEIEA